MISAFQLQKTIVAPQLTTVLGWMWSLGQFSTSQHHISAFSKCSPPHTVKGLSSFLGVYNVLSQVIRGFI